MSGDAVNARLADRVFVVTGAAGGIGRGIVRALLDDGASVVATDLDQQRTADAAAELDPADTASLDRVVASAVERLGRLDGLVNNAGTIVMDAAWDASISDWSRQLEVNVTAAFAMARAVGSHLRGAGGGSIVNVAQPIEVGRVIAFLLSDDAKIIRGQSINVDGGDTPY